MIAIVGPSFVSQALSVHTTVAIIGAAKHNLGRLLVLLRLLILLHELVLLLSVLNQVDLVLLIFFKVKEGWLIADLSSLQLGRDSLVVLLSLVLLVQDSVLLLNVQVCGCSVQV